MRRKGETTGHLVTSAKRQRLRKQKIKNSSGISRKLGSFPSANEYNWINVIMYAHVKGLVVLLSSKWDNYLNSFCTIMNDWNYNGKRVCLVSNTFDSFCVSHTDIRHYPWALISLSSKMTQIKTHKISHSLTADTFYCVKYKINKCRECKGLHYHFICHEEFICNIWLCRNYYTEEATYLVVSHLLNVRKYRANTV